MSKSKVKEYIAQVKRSDRTAAEALTQNGQTGAAGGGKLGTLEDLYGIDDLASQSSSTAKVELRKSLREIKEKDMLILKLREACHELTLKYADAENTIDQLRFGTITHAQSKSGRGSRGIQHGTSVGSGPLVKSRSAFCLAGAGTPTGVESVKKVEKRDQATAMSPIPEPLKSFLQTTNDCEEYNNSWSSYDVLDESCSNWMEKVENWKTADSLFNTSADADSGFRGSDVNVNPKGTGTGAKAIGTGSGGTGNGTGSGPNAHLSPVPPPGPSTHTHTNTNSSSGSRNNFGANASSQPQLIRGSQSQRPGLSPISAFSMHAGGKPTPTKTGTPRMSTRNRGTNTEEGPGDEDDEEQEPKYEPRGQRGSNSKASQCDPVEEFPVHYRRVKSQSYDNLRALSHQPHAPPAYEHQGGDPNASPYHSKRLSMSNIGAGPRYYSESTTYFKSLDPLLDDATRLAKRVQYKSQKLARQLQQTLDASKSKR